MVDLFTFVIQTTIKNRKTQKIVKEAIGLSVGQLLLGSICQVSSRYLSEFHSYIIGLQK